MLGLGSNLSTSSSNLITPTIVTDLLVQSTRFTSGAGVPVSDGAAYFFNVDHIEVDEFTMDTDGNCSFVFWAKRTEVSSEDAVIGHTSQTGYQILRFNSNTTMALESASSDEATITLHSPNDFDWHHYAIICTSGTVTAYQDGVSCSVANAAMGSNTTFDTIGAAGSDGDSKNFQGYLCNLGLYTRAITDAEVKSIMNSNYAGLTKGEKVNLREWWNLDSSVRVGSDDLTNNSVNLNHGILTD